jgi:hypothetical protein
MSVLPGIFAALRFLFVQSETVSAIALRGEFCRTYMVILDLTVCLILAGVSWELGATGFL